MCVFIFSVASTGNILGAFLKFVTWLTFLVPDLVLYLCVMVLSTLISLFGVYSTSGITWGRASGVSAFIIPIFIFGYLPFYCCNCWIFTWLKCFIFFSGCTYWSSYGYVSTIGTLKGFCICEWLIWLGWIFIWVSSWITCRIFLVYPLDWHPRRYCWGGCFSKYIR